MDRSGRGRRRHCGRHRGGPLIDAWLQQVAEWPPAIIYLVLAAGTLVENILPPIPADVAVALGAFLVHSGITSAWGVFLAGWGGSVAGALLVHAIARRWGTMFLRSRFGRLVVQPDAFVIMERGYLRFGMAGIFAMRLLPGFRSVVAPFTGLVPLTTWRALLPLALASGLWYGGITLVGARLGENWETIQRLLNNLNATLAVLAGIVLVGAVIVVVSSRRRRRRAQLWEAFHQAFEHDPVAEARSREDPAYAASAILLLELARSDEGLTPNDHVAIATFLRERWHLPEETTTGPTPTPVNPGEFARILGLRYALGERVGLWERLRMLGREHAPPHQDRLMERAASMLGLGPDDLPEPRPPKP